MNISDDLIRVNVRVLKDSHPDLYAELARHSKDGRAELIRRLATSYLDIKSGGGGVSRANGLPKNTDDERKSNEPINSRERLSGLRM